MVDETPHHGRCEDWLAQISDYIDGELETELCAHLEAHLQRCHNCQVLLDTTQKTLVLYRRRYRSRQLELPESTRQRLWQALADSGCITPSDS